MYFFVIALMLAKVDFMLFRFCWLFCFSGTETTKTMLEKLLLYGEMRLKSMAGSNKTTPSPLSYQAEEYLEVHSNDPDYHIIHSYLKYIYLKQTILNR